MIFCLFDKLVIRNHIKLYQNKALFIIYKNKALFIFVNNILPPTGEILAEVYKHHKDTDGFLYITYACENVFGIS